MNIYGNLYSKPSIPEDNLAVVFRRIWFIRRYLDGCQKCRNSSTRCRWFSAALDSQILQIPPRNFSATFADTMADWSWNAAVKWAFTPRQNLLVNPAGTWPYLILGALSISTRNTFWCGWINPFPSRWSNTSSSWLPSERLRSNLKSSPESFTPSWPCPLPDRPTHPIALPSLDRLRKLAGKWRLH